MRFRSRGRRHRVKRRGVFRGSRRRGRAGRRRRSGALRIGYRM